MRGFLSGDISDHSGQVTRRYINHPCCTTWKCASPSASFATAYAGGPLIGNQTLPMRYFSTSIPPISTPSEIKKCFRSCSPAAEVLKRQLFILFSVRIHPRHVQRGREFAAPITTMSLNLPSRAKRTLRNSVFKLV